MTASEAPLAGVRVDRRVRLHLERREMKHEQLVRRMLAELHESWMDEQDKADFDAEMIRQFGAQLDADIDTGIASGFTGEQQECIVRALFRAMRR